MVWKKSKREVDGQMEEGDMGGRRGSLWDRKKVLENKRTKEEEEEEEEENEIGDKKNYITRLC